MELAGLITQAVAAIATAVAAIAALRAARAAQESARQGAADLEDERKARRIEGLLRLHAPLIEMESLGLNPYTDWKPAFARFRAASFAVSEPLAKCTEFNNAAISKNPRHLSGLLRKAIEEVEHAISRAKQGRPMGDTDHAV